MSGWNNGAGNAEQAQLLEDVLGTALVKSQVRQLMKAASRRGSKVSLEDVREDFEAWWRHYPRKVAKIEAARAYARARRLASKQELLETMMAQAEASGWYRDQTFCPHAATWCNQGRWMDETTSVSTTSQQKRTGQSFGSSADWLDEHCRHQPPCSNITNCQNLCAIEDYKASRNR